MRTSLPADPQTLNPMLFLPQHPTPISLRFSLCISWDPFTPDLGSLHTAMDSVSGWLLPRSLNYKLCKCSVVRNTPSIGHKLCIWRIPPKESPDNKSTLVWKSFSSCAGVGTLHRWCHRAQRCLVRNGWENRGCLKFHQVQKGFGGCPESL